MAKIIVDSACDLTKELKKDENIISVPITITLDNEDFLDDENLNLDEFLDKLNLSKNVPKTSAPSPEKFLNSYKSDDNLFVVTLSSKLSGSYNSAVLAKNICKDEFPKKFVYVFDSLSASIGETLIALKIKECIDQNFNNDQIITIVNSFISSMKTYFILENFNVVVKTGRMNSSVAKIASMLNIIPVCYGNEGKMDVLFKARGYNNSIKKLIKIILEQNASFENKILGISHVKCLNKALEFKKEISSLIKFKDIIITECGGLCSTYANINGLIISF